MIPFTFTNFFTNKIITFREASNQILTAIDWMDALVQQLKICL